MLHNPNPASPAELALYAEQTPLALAGRAADDAAAKAVFGDYRERLAHNTRRRHNDALALLAQALGDPQAGGPGIPGAPSGEELAESPEAWAGMTWGLVSFFGRWLLARGYAIGSINGYLSVLRVYAGLAMQAGKLDADRYAAIRAVKGYRHNEGRHVDAQRARTRTGAKKAQPVILTTAQAAELRQQPATPQGRRDAVILALLLDHGLRVGELAGLLVTDVDLAGGELRFYRPKVDRIQTHALTPAALGALRAYIEAGDAPAMGPLLRGSKRGGELTAAGMTERAINQRVRILGEGLGILGLSPHDLRHHWATRAARNGTPLDRLQDAGGWASPAMPLAYLERAAIANAGVLLG